MTEIITKCVSIYPPMLDIVMHKEKAQLEKAGLVPNSIISYDPEKYGRLEKKIQEGIQNSSLCAEYKAGGATLNTQKVLAEWMPCEFFGLLGEDEYGKMLEKEMRSTKRLKINLEKSPDFSTCWAYVFLTGDERTILAKQDMHMKYTPQYMQHIFQTLGSKEIFYFVSFIFFLEHLSEQTFEVLRQKKEKGFYSVLNLSSEDVVRKRKESVLQAMQYADFVIGNRGEFYKLAQVEDAENLYTWLDERGISYAITDGPNKVVGKCIDGGLEEAYPPVLKHNINTNGAGDAFAAGFLSTLRNGRISHQSLRAALQTGISVSIAQIKKNTRDTECRRTKK